jgi:LPXTG-motif cell wall-anchored protein
MKTLKSLAIVFGVCLFLLGSTLRADDWDKKTIITFSGPVHVADTQLPAGTYTFKLMDNMANRHIVQIFNADETQIIATIMAIPDLRLTPTGDTVVRFSETNNGSETSGSMPESGLPMKKWFFAGDSSGVEFPVAAQTPVAEAQPAPAAEPAAAPAPAPEPPPAPAAAAPPPVTAAPPPAEEPPAQEAAPTPPPQTEQTAPAPEQQSAPEQLPQTASQMPWLGLMGILCLAAAASFRVLLKISA